MLKLGLMWASALRVYSRHSKSGHPETERNWERGVSHHPPRPCAQSRLLLFWKCGGEVVLRQGQILGAEGQSIPEREPGSQDVCQR